MCLPAGRQVKNVFSGVHSPYWVVILQAEIDQNPAPPNICSDFAWEKCVGTRKISNTAFSVTDRVGTATGVSTGLFYTFGHRVSSGYLLSSVSFQVSLGNVVWGSIRF